MKLRDLIKQELIEANNQPSEKDMVKVINRQFSALNINFKISGMPPQGKLGHAGTKEIPLKQLGDFGNIFKVVKVGISVGWDDHGVALSLHYEWKFQNGGNNGHKVRHILPHGSNKWEVG